MGPIGLQDLYGRQDVDTPCQQGHRMQQHQPVHTRLPLIPNRPHPTFRSTVYFSSTSCSTRFMKQSYATSRPSATPLTPQEWRVTTLTLSPAACQRASAASGLSCGTCAITPVEGAVSAVVRKGLLWAPPVAHEASKKSHTVLAAVMRMAQTHTCQRHLAALLNAREGAHRLLLQKLVLKLGGLRMRTCTPYMHALLSRGLGRSCQVHVAWVHMLGA